MEISTELPPTVETWFQSPEGGVTVLSPLHRSPDRSGHVLGNEGAGSLGFQFHVLLTCLRQLFASRDLL